MLNTFKKHHKMTILKPTETLSGFNNFKGENTWIREIMMMPLSVESKPATAEKITLAAVPTLTTLAMIFAPN